MYTIHGIISLAFFAHTRRSEQPLTLKLETLATIKGVQLQLYEENVVLVAEWLVHLPLGLEVWGSISAMFQHAFLMYM